MPTNQNQLTKFLLYYFISKLQTEAYNACQLTATAADSNTAMVQIDYYENVSCLSDEVSSAHWKTNRVTPYEHCSLDKGQQSKLSLPTHEGWY